MNKKFFLVFSLSLILLCSFFFVPVTSAYASTGQTYTYSGEVSSDSSNLGNYAIESVESLNVEGSLVYKIVFGVSYNPLTFRFLFSNQSSGSSQSGNYFFVNYGYLSNSQVDCNFAFRCLSSDTGMTYNVNGSSAGKINGTTYYYRSLVLSVNNTYELYFSTASIGGTYSNMTFGQTSSCNRYFSNVYNNSDYDLSSFIDMNSDTNFSITDIDFDFESEDLNKISNYFYGFPVGRGGVLSQTFSRYTTTLSVLSTYTPCNSSAHFGQFLRGSSVLFNEVQFSYLYSVNADNNSRLSTDRPSNATTGYFFSSFYFQINRPVYRTNNTLIIYNFDYYNFLSNTESLTYQLQKGSDYYNISYSGDLPNSYFIYVYNNDISNMIFDQYIYFYLSSSKVIYYDYRYISPDDIFLGFDFNFTYYNNPLVTSNGSFNYTFEKPSYVDMPFSLVPFYLPILEAIENGLIFLMFYCPITSHILTFMHLDEFFGALFNVFSFSNGGISILGINLGSFIWACVAFVIFFMLLRSFMPIMWGSVKAESSELYNKVTYNKRRYKNELKNKNIETKYTVYKYEKDSKKFAKEDKRLKRLNKNSS